MTGYDYQNVEGLLLKLLGLLHATFKDSEKSEVQSFVDVGEYGLALETLVDIAVEENKKIPEEAMSVVIELAGVMELDKKVYEKKLSEFVVADQG